MAEPEVTVRELPDGRIQVDVLAGGHSVSGLRIVPCTIRVGAATVRMDGIADVHTDPEHRRQGYARRLLEAAVERMRGRAAALTMLYGIPDFYHRFGYATAGPDHRLHLTGLGEPPALPDGWTARPITPGDLPVVRRLYALATAEASGAAVRPADGWVWSRLLAEASTPAQAPEDDGELRCSVLVGPDGGVRAYVWRGQGFWYADWVQREYPDDLVLAEAVAGDRAGARAALALCRQWAAAKAARGRPVRRVTLGVAPEGHLAQAAAYEDAVLEQRHDASGGSMARVLDTERLLAALRPELARRAAAAGLPPDLRLVCETDEGKGSTRLSSEGPGAAGPTTPGEVVRLRLPQTALARLALGAFPPLDLCDGLVPPLGGRERETLAVLFPARRPHMCWPDRY